MMLTWLQKNIRGILLLLLILLGLSIGQLAASLLGLSIGQPTSAPPARPVAAAARPSIPPLKDYTDILQRNIFKAQTGDLTEVGKPAPAAAASAPGRQSAAGLTLIGTVTGGPVPLAVITHDKETETFRLGAQVPGGGKLASVDRNQVEIAFTDGHRETLQVATDQPGSSRPGTGRPSTNGRRSAAVAAARASGNDYNIRQVGENRWQIPAAAAEKARSNLNDLLRQARVEPNIINGKTDGFVVRMIQPGTLLAMLGIKVGDVLHEINGVTLDTPEKALQIFQQLREAKQIQISLDRGSKPQVFNYEIQ